MMYAARSSQLNALRLWALNIEHPAILLDTTSPTNNSGLKGYKYYQTQHRNIYYAAYCR